MMTEPRGAARVTVRLEASDADPREVDQLTRQLLQEIRQRSDVVSADLARSGPAPAHAKSDDLVQTGQIVLQTLAPAVPGLVTLLRGWSGRRKQGLGPGVTVKLTVQDRSMDVEYPVGSMSHDDLMSLVAIVANHPSQPGQEPGPAKQS
jgi:hypothetical protein